MSREPETHRFAVICDSACDLSSDYLGRHGVTCVPLHVRIDGEDLLDLRDVETVDYYPRLMMAKADPEVSHPSPAEYMAAYQQAIADGFDAVLVLTMSARLSGSNGAALTAARSVAHSNDVSIEVVDTRLASAGEAIAVDAAVQARDAGASLREAAERATAVASATRLYFVPGRSVRLARGGLARSGRDLLSRLLGAKPLITFDESGALVEDCRSADLSEMTGRVARIMSRYASQRGALAYVEVCAGMPRTLTLLEKPLDTNEFESRLRAIVNVCPSVVSRVGVGTIGIAFVPESVYEATIAGPGEAGAASDAYDEAAVATASPDDQRPTTNGKEAHV